MRVDGSNDVQQARNHDEASAPVGDGELYGFSAETHDAAYDVEQAASQIAKQAQYFEDVVGIRVETTLHGKAERKHADDGDGEERTAPPLAEKKMSGAGDEPSGYKR